MKLRIILCILTAVLFMDSLGCSSQNMSAMPAKSAQPNVVYFIDDHQGSTHLVTDSLGNVLHEESRFPYGTTKYEDGTGKPYYSYTGKEYDIETGLIYFGGRYYSPDIGRWITPDPLFLEKDIETVFERPASWNLYIYVTNNPMTLVDLLGYIEGSPSNIAKRALIDKIARGYDQSTLWAKDIKKDNFGIGINKCNKFVFDVTKEAKSDGVVNGRPPLAAEWADPNTKIPNWRLLKPDEKPEPGDVTAYKLSGGGTAYSGHTGIMISDGEDDITNISAHKDAVFTIEGQFEDRIDERYRRFTGD